MRRTIRPFVKEFKSRSAKSPATRATPAEETGAEPAPPPPLFDLAELATRVKVEATHDDGYAAAMRAADLVFGKPTPPAPPAAPVEAAPASPILAPTPTPPAPTGRVLPSLIEVETAREIEPEKPVRRRGRPRKIAPAAIDAEPAVWTPPAAPSAPPTRTPPTPRTPPTHRAPPPAPRKHEPAPRPVATLAAALFERESDEPPSTTRRVRRPIQLRWVLGKELRAGERWKRRLPEPAR
jgi:hypothetical protein